MCRGQRKLYHNLMEAHSARLAVKSTGFVSRAVELDIFLVNPLIPVHAVLLRVVPHCVVPPVEKRMDLGLIDRVAETAAGIVLHRSPRDVIYFPVALQRIQHEKQPGFMIV